MEPHLSHRPNSLKRSARVKNGKYSINILTRVFRAKMTIALGWNLLDVMLRQVILRRLSFGGLTVWLVT